MKKITSLFLAVLLASQIGVQAASEEAEYASFYYDAIAEKGVGPKDESKLGYQAENVWKEFYVATDGNDSNNGTKDSPFATLERARDEVRKINKSMTGDIVVHIASGTYYIDELFELDIDDSGFNGHNVIWLGDTKNPPVLSGGRTLDKMTPSQTYPGLYEVKVDYPDRILNLYVNGESREVAASNHLIQSLKRPDAWNTDEWKNNNPNDGGKPYEYYNPETLNSSDGVFVSKEQVMPYENIEDVIAVYNPQFRTAIVPIKRIFDNPLNSEQYIIEFGDMWDILSRRRSIYISGGKAFSIKNAFELLDEPGEFYFNRKTQTLYYKPYADEDMSEAEVIMPYETDILRIKGVDKDTVVKNITIEGLKFAYTMYNQWSYNGFCSNYGTSNDAYGWMSTTNQPNQAVSLAFCENVTMKNNHFKNIGGNAIKVIANTDKLNFVGNSFIDIGNMGLLVEGYNNHVTDENGGYIQGTPNEEQKKLPLDLLSTPYMTVDVSYDGAAPNTDTYGVQVLLNRPKFENWGSRISRTSWVEEYNYPESAWKSDPNAPARGEKSWMMYDFGGKYDVDKIALAFHKDYVSDAEKNNYEVLLSNDRYFSEGDYKVVATQTTPADEIQEYVLDDIGEYRYLMIRTLGATPLACSQVYAFTDDEQPYPQMGRSPNIYVSNNLFVRGGVNVENGTAMCLNFCEYKTVIHNEVQDFNYSGIQAIGGNGVNIYSEHAYSYLGQNKMTNCSIITHDGSAFYVHSYAPYSIVEGNFVDNNNTGQFGYYTDSGASAWLFNNNAIEDSPLSNSFYTAQLKNGTVANHGRNMYANHSKEVVVHIDSFDKIGYDKTIFPWDYYDNDVDAPIVYVKGQPTKEVYSIIEESGLEPEYQWMRELITDIPDDSFDYLTYYEETGKESETLRNRRRDSLIEEAQNMLDNGKFGYRLGEFALVYKAQLEESLSNLKATTNTTMNRSAMDIRGLMNEIKASQRRYSLEETLQMCKDTAANTVVDNSGNPKFGTVSQKDKDTFTDIISDVESRMDKAYTTEEEFDMLIELETAYNDFYGNCRNAKIEALNTKGIIKTEFDYDNLIAYVHTTPSADLSELEIVVSDGAEIATTISKKADYDKGVLVPIYSKECKKHQTWTIRAVAEEATDAQDITEDSFVIDSFKQNSHIKDSKEGMMLTANPNPYMSNVFNKETKGATVSFKPYFNTGNGSFRFIIGASSAVDFKLENNNSKYDRLEVEFTEDEMKLYSVLSGKSKLITSYKMGVKPNELNTFTYEFRKINNTGNVILELNGKRVVNDAFKGTIKSGYFGVLSENINIEIFDKQ